MKSTSYFILKHLWLYLHPKNSWNYTTILSNNWKYVLFLNRPILVRIWMWSAILCVGFYLIKFSIIDPVPTILDMVLMAYGLGSIGVYVLVYEFDWS